MLQNIHVTIKLRSIAVGGDSVGEVQAAQIVGDVNLDKYGLSDVDALRGITAFVPYGIPGEEVKAQVVEVKPKFIRAEIVSVIQESLDREVPPCRYFMQCGGCELQHIDYRAQIEFKQEMVKGALRSGKLPLEVIEKVPELIRSEPFFYRRRIHLHIDTKGQVGFYRTGTRSIVPITECLIASKALQEGIRKIKDIAPSISGRINSVYLEESDGDILAVCIAPYELNNSELKIFTSRIGEAFKHIVIRAAGKDVFVEGAVSPKLYLNKSHSVFVRIPGGGFSQVNWAINLSLVESVTNYLRSLQVTHVIDLFSGAGNFSMSLAKDGFSVIAVESDKRLVSMGRETAKEQGFIKNIRFEEMSVEHYLKRAQRDLVETQAIILDPPRSGLGSLSSELTFANHIILIACHLPSFVRDLRSFLENGYTLDHIELYDMFPQTSYLESVAYLRK